MKTSFTEDQKFTQDDLKESFDKKVEDYKKLGANVSVTSDENSITYTITVKKGNESHSITLSSLVPGLYTL